MTSQNYVADSEWGRLADLPEAERQQTMTERFRELLSLPQEERHRRLRVITESEYALPDSQLRLLTVSRMRSLLQLTDEEGRNFSTAYDAVMREMPATAAMRRVSMVQTLALEFSAEDEERLRAMIPTIFAGAPRRKTGLEVSGPSLQTQAPGKKRPFWMFWRKG